MVSLQTFRQRLAAALPGDARRAIANAPSSRPDGQTAGPAGTRPRRHAAACRHRLRKLARSTAESRSPFHRRHAGLAELAERRRTQARTGPQPQESVRRAGSSERWTAPASRREAPFDRAVRPGRSGHSGPASALGASQGKASLHSGDKSRAGRRQGIVNVSLCGCARRSSLPVENARRRRHVTAPG